MKKLYCLFLLLISFQLLIAQEDTPEPILDSELEEQESSDDQIFISYYNPMPYLASCQDSTYYYNKQASDKKMLEYIYTNLVYPSAAKSKGIEGMAVVTFSITKDGDINPKSIKLLRDPGGDCGQAAIKIVHNMAIALGKWVPGKQRGKAVDVRYNLPVRFKLSDIKKSCLKAEN